MTRDLAPAIDERPVLQVVVWLPLAVEQMGNHERHGLLREQNDVDVRVARLLKALDFVGHEQQPH